MLPRPRPRASCAALAAVVAAWLAGCASPPPSGPAPRRPEDVRAQIVAAIPTGVPDRAGWAVDVQAAFVALGLPQTRENICAALAVAGQESGFAVDPVVPRLPAIARAEIDRRAEKLGVPLFLVHAALKIPSPTGQSYDERIDGVKTEQDLSRLYEDLLSRVPLGERLFGGLNPVRTAGPMQVGVAFAEKQIREKPYPYAIEGSVRHEVFTRRGGLYFGIAHLLDYPAGYDRMLYRFADFNAGRYASRNAAFQQAVSLASGVPLALDGDLVRRTEGDAPGSTEAAVRSLAPRLGGLDEAAIHRALLEGDGPGFESTALYRRVFELADGAQGRALPRAVVPRIELQSPKITRKLTTEWFADRVEGRYRRCLSL